jgi:hypothetical protein
MVRAKAAASISSRRICMVDGCERSALERCLGELRRDRRTLWLAEFSCGDGADWSPEAQVAYMREAVLLFESNPRVFRCAWFSGCTEVLPSADLLGASGGITALGELHASLARAARCSP